ncbi:hypothetical protein [Neisseria elongata]|uniref:hypothetical protein n=1 Tax=Neisseria elongata TaxID=495 RepID=UPI000D33873B|nr:hypothetical protein [Neisseria elongata]DAK47272.1 MAG TPA: hypothetical protein [Caudoviricetes sp.]
MQIILTDIAPFNLNIDAGGLRAIPVSADAPILNVEERLELQANGFRVAVNAPAIEIRCFAVYQYLLKSDEASRTLVDINMAYLAAFDVISDPPVDLTGMGNDPEKMRTLLNFTEQAVRFKISTILNQLGIRTRYPLAVFEVNS